MSHYPTVYIILVNYNGWHDTIECLESIFRCNYPNYKVVVVDNNSTDDSMELLEDWANGKVDVWSPSQNKLRDHFFPPVPKPVPYLICTEEGVLDLVKNADHQATNESLIFIKAKENGGFAGGNNLGIKLALKNEDCTYVWLLNNDTVIKEDSLTVLIDHIVRREDVAAVGSKIYYYDDPNLLQSVGSKVDKSSVFGLCKPIINTGKENYDLGQFNNDFEVNDIMGASLLMKTEIIKKHGLIPEEYFLYGEETDWNFKVQTKGYKLLTIPGSIVYHKESRATGGTQGPILLYYKTRNQFILYRKYKNVFISNFRLYFILYIMRKVIYALTLNVKSRKAIFAGLMDGLKGKTGRSTPSE